MRSIDLVKNYLIEQGYILDTIELGYPKAKKYFMISSPGSSGGMALSATSVTYPFSSSVAKEIAKDKTKSYDLANYLNISTPSTSIVSKGTSDSSVIEKMLADNTSLIVKPYDSNHSNGVSRNLTSLNLVLEALDEAFSYSNKALIQRQYFGEEVRICVIDGVARAVLLREKPAVVGDGHSSVQELIETENRKRQEITNSLVPYPQLNQELVDSDLLHDGTIPEEGVHLELSQATLISKGASVYNVLTSIDPHYLSIAQKLAACLPARVVSVDLMIEDYKRYDGDDSYGLIEVNTGMSLTMFYSCRDGNHFPIIEEYIGPIIQEGLSNWNIRASKDGAEHA